MNVGITGHSGFIGSHLYNYLIQKEDITLIPFKRQFFSSVNVMTAYLQRCDVLVHLAGMNRGPDKQIYDINIQLAEKLAVSLEQLDSPPHVIFSSSIHEKKDTPYGKSKHESRLILSKWAKRRDAKFTGLIIPNVFGPFCRPFYNSVVATFCHQLTHDIEPEIHVDQPIKLVYIDDLLQTIYNAIKHGLGADELHVEASKEILVSELLSKLRYYKEKYVNEKVIPCLEDPFDLSLFNSFRSYIDLDYYPVSYKLKVDERGNLVEVVKSLNQGQVFFSTTKPGIERGNHYHRRKLERFIIINGKARVQLRRVGEEEIIEYNLDGDNPSYIDIPVLYTHNLVNTGDEELLMLFWASELFNPDDPDTIYEKVQVGSR